MFYMFCFWCGIGGGVDEPGGGPAHAGLRSPTQDPLSGHQRAAEGSVGSICVTFFRY